MPFSSLYASTQLDTTINAEVAASGGVGRSIVVENHGMKTVGEVILIKKSTGRRVLADWWQADATPSGPVVIDFNNAVSANEFIVRVFGTPDPLLKDAIPDTFSWEARLEAMGATTWFDTKDLT